ncbi:MAG: fibronectin type III domain-containing protein, partial [Oscillospiraceae bacterium]|nr:fibronectin type III domain-containing protein [Oscillospiraceae bacterium]
MMIESLGAPVGLFATENYSTNAFIAAQDHGIPNVREIVWCDVRRESAALSGTAPATMTTPPGSSADDNSNYYQLASAYTNRNSTTGRVRALVNHYQEPPLSRLLLQRGEPGEAKWKYAAPEQRWMPEDHWVMSSKSVLEQAIWSATAPLTEEEKNPSLIAPEELGNLNYGVISAPAKELTFAAPTYEQAVQQFMDFARDNKFGDGMALIPPTPELVNEMLAATTRDRNDVIGYVYLRGGAMTIENLAINAVMSGLKPNAFPVFIAAAEALGQGWEENNVWWHAMTGNTHSVALIVSGPVVDEIGMSTGRGQSGSGNEVNNALGRSMRMLWRNIARNIQPNLDISNNTYRMSGDIMIVTAAENVAATRSIGWPTHSETLGFGNGSSSVTLMTVSSGGAGFNSSSTAWNAAWTATGLAGLLQSASANNLTTAANAQLGFSTNYCGIVSYTPAQAKMLAANYASKQAVMDSRAHAWELAALQGPSNINYNNAVAYGVVGYRLSMGYPIILSEDPDGSHTLSVGLHTSTTFINQKVTGAALPGAEPGTKAATSPAAPQNFVVDPLVYDAATDTYSAKLTWDAPTTDGGMPIKRYEIYYLSGLDEVAFRWLEVPGGATAREVTVTNLLPG